MVSACLRPHQSACFGAVYYNVSSSENGDVVADAPIKNGDVDNSISNGVKLNNDDNDSLRLNRSNNEVDGLSRVLSWSSDGSIR